MEDLVRLLSRAQPGISIRSQIEESKVRLGEVETAFLYPRFDGDKYIETVCLTCLDKGWIVKYPADWLQGHGRPEYVSCPDCGGWDMTANMLSHSGIPGASRSQRFENFKILTGTEEAYKAVRLITAEQQNLDQAQIIFCLVYGGTGNGKTHLAHASGIEAINHGTPVKFVRCGALLREFKSAKSSNDEGQTKYDGLFTGYAECLYLIIDELDWKTDPDVRMIEDLVCERWANHLMTLITTNRDLGELEDTFPRMMSRFRDNQFSRLVLNTGNDYRRRGK